MHVSWRANSARSRSDRGASFGLGAIVSQVSAEAFGEQLGRIVPRLFRYRFDPSAKTRSAMEQLWRSVVGGGGDFSSREKEVCLYSLVDIRAQKGSDERGNNEAHTYRNTDCLRSTGTALRSAWLCDVGVCERAHSGSFRTILRRRQHPPLPLASELKALFLSRFFRVLANLPPAPLWIAPQLIRTNLSAIIVELLRALGERKWRDRQAACAALSDLLRGRGWEEIGPHLELLWKMADRRE